MRGKDKKGIGYREVRQYHTDLYFLQFVFMTRCYNTYVESNLHPSSPTEYHLGKYFLEEVESNLYKWISELIHPLQQYIYSSTILGGRILQSDEVLIGGYQNR
jgi:hypothetical protein